MKRISRQRGFTLIEIVLVLAIGSLLLVTVFLAVSGAQRSRRDHQRKQDLAALVASVIAWKGNNLDKNLETQADLDVVVDSYFRRKDPWTGLQYDVDTHDVAIAHSAATAPSLGGVGYYPGHICGSDVGVSTLIKDGAAVHGARQFALIIKLESGDAYCQDHK